MILLSNAGTFGKAYPEWLSSMWDLNIETDRLHKGREGTIRKGKENEEKRGSSKEGGGGQKQARFMCE